MGNIVNYEGKTYRVLNRTPEFESYLRGYTHATTAYVVNRHKLAKHCVIAGCEGKRHEYLATLIILEHRKEKAKEAVAHGCRY